MPGMIVLDCLHLMLIDLEKIRIREKLESFREYNYRDNVR